MTDEIELCSVLELDAGDWIILDDGSEQTVRGTDRVNCTKNQMRIRLKARPPIIVDGYYRPLIRRLG